MIVKYLGSASNLITIVATELDNYLANLVDYTGITITSNKNCSSTSAEKTYDNVEVIDNTNDFFIEGGILYVKPIVFGLTSFTDGVYKINVKFNTLTGYVLISNCLFVDVTYKCKVASLLPEMLEENKLEATEKVSTLIHILHYSLVNGSNCGCNCDEMCEVFNSLTDLLTGVNPEITNDCGC